MGQLDYANVLDNVVERPTRTKSSSKKRKWREIETLKDKHKLLKELKEIDNNFQLDYNDILA
ncbi:DUF3545 family protein [Parashewanella tropica]|uniref:DUF3545 family protein n=1 Tax=Parashewanella tropica TaxID=2547970 RepID=UPI001059853E|nr:DUF3545 family protein [Parashewanella tropica]